MQINLHNSKKSSTFGHLPVSVVHSLTIPPKIRSHPAEYMQMCVFLFSTTLRVPDSKHTYVFVDRYEPRSDMQLQAGGLERGGDAWERPSPRGCIRYLNSLGMLTITE